MRPSANTSIFAPTRCGVDPVVETMVTRAAGSPRSSAAATAAKTSRFIFRKYSAAPCWMAGLQNCRKGRSKDLDPFPFPFCNPAMLTMQLADLARLGPGDEALRDDLGTGRRRELAGLRVDVDEGDPWR